MRKIKLNLAVSLDGFIAGPNGEYDWCLTDADYGMTAFINSVDATLMGRKTYELILEFGPPYPTLTNYVFSRTISTSEFNNVVFVNEDISTFVKTLRTAPGKDIWLYGGGEIIDELMNSNCIDEFVLSVHPLLLGNGIPLFKEHDHRTQLKLKDVIKYPSGLVQLIYIK
jgi:dihydrofolate reductase